MARGRAPASDARDGPFGWAGPTPRSPVRGTRRRLGRKVGRCRSAPSARVPGVPVHPRVPKDLPSREGHRAPRRPGAHGPAPGPASTAAAHAWASPRARSASRAARRGNEMRRVRGGVCEACISRQSPRSDWPSSAGRGYLGRARTLSRDTCCTRRGSAAFLLTVAAASASSRTERPALVLANDSRTSPRALQRLSTVDRHISPAVEVARDHGAGAGPVRGRSHHAACRRPRRLVRESGSHRGCRCPARSGLVDPMPQVWCAPALVGDARTARIVGRLRLPEIQSLPGMR
jgi:hypothetical protein